MKREYERAKLCKDDDGYYYSTEPNDEPSRDAILAMGILDEIFADKKVFDVIYLLVSDRYEEHNYKIGATFRIEGVALDLHRVITTPMLRELDVQRDVVIDYYKKRFMLRIERELSKGDGSE